ncbi:hypothetical protein GEMRC1_005880 [Eukaryota sp. GEM-RC1]
MNHGPPLKKTRSFGDSLSNADDAVCNGSSSTVFFPQSHSDTLSASPSFSLHHPKTVRFQQSLLILVLLNLLRRLLKSCFAVNLVDPRRSLLSLKQELPKVLANVGYVSSSCFESLCLTFQVFFQTNTFHLLSQDLPQLCSYAALFGAEVRSVFLHLDDVVKMKELTVFSHMISELKLTLTNQNDLEFFRTSTCFPRLKHLHVGVNSSIVVPFVDMLKDNDTVTCVNLRNNSIGVEGARALAEALIVNTYVITINLWNNSIGVEGARALAEALKLNDCVTVINLGYNSIGDEGARALAEALKVNATLTTVNLRYNSIGIEGARALAEALKDNDTVTSVNLRYNFIGDEGAVVLSQLLTHNCKVSVHGISTQS